MKSYVGVVWFSLLFLVISQLVFAGSEAIPEKMRSRLLFSTGEKSEKSENAGQFTSGSPEKSEKNVLDVPTLATSQATTEPIRRFHPSFYLGVAGVVAITIFFFRRKNKVLAEVEEDEEW